MCVGKCAKFPRHHSWSGTLFFILIFFFVIIGNVLSGRLRVWDLPLPIPFFPLLKGGWELSGSCMWSSSQSSLSVAPTVGWSADRGRQSCQSLSISLYFLRRMETWSLNSTGSSLIWECTRGMPPNQLANLFMQV